MCAAAARSSQPTREGHWGHQRPTRFNKFVTVHCTRPRGVYACYRLYLPNFPLLIGHSVRPLSSKSVPTISREHSGTRNMWHFNLLCLCAHTWTTLFSIPKTVLHGRFTKGQRKILWSGSPSSQPSTTRSPACATDESPEVSRALVALGPPLYTGPILFLLTLEFYNS